MKDDKKKITKASAVVDRASEFAEFVSDLRDKYDLQRTVKEVVSTGILGLDLATRIGGIPRGCIVDLYGEEGLGKTTLALSLMAERVKRGEFCAYLDVEHRVDPELVAMIVGEDYEQYMSLQQPANAEKTLEEIIALSAKVDSQGKPLIKMIVIDSVAALLPEHCVTMQEKEQTAEIARIMSSHLKLVNPIRYANGTIIVYINQIRSRPMVMGAMSSQPTGGRALRFYASLRMNIIRSAYIREGEELRGQKVDVLIEKNSFGAPHGRTPLSIIFGEGVDKVRDLIDWGMSLGVIRKSSSWYYYEYLDAATGEIKELKGNGEAALVEQLKPIFQHVYDQIKALHAEKVKRSKPEVVDPIPASTETPVIYSGGVVPSVNS